MEVNARKREERLAEDKMQLEKLINIKKCYERGETKEYQKRMRQNLVSNKDELEVSSVGLLSFFRLQDFSSF